MKFMDKLRNSFIRNPGASMFLGILLLAEYGNYQRGHELTHVCQLVEARDQDFGAALNHRSPYVAHITAQIENVCGPRLTGS